MKDKFNKMNNECYTEEKKMNWLRSEMIGGASAEFESPFGVRSITYADSTASACSLRFIEDYIISNVLPFYGNTHTSDSYVGQQTTKTIEEATRYIKKCLGGGQEDAILFCGSGTTAAIKKLQELIGVATPSNLRATVSRILSDEERWVVFVGPYEHHSNLLSWRNSLVEVVEIALSEDGGSIDMEALRAKLEYYYETTNRPMLGSFSACSNVTGIVSDTRAIARLLHQYGAFACFDFAASGPYVEINMKSGELDGYDAIFVSPHKFIGGPGSPGILLMSKKLYQLTSLPPSTCGGGTVSYVNGFNEEDTLYAEAIEERENAGTPPILQTIRAALAFWVKEYIGYKNIEQQEKAYMARAMAKLGNNKNIKILGNTSVKRQAILSFLVYPDTHQLSGGEPEHRECKPLNGRFVAKLLNDLFGIQARGGCACAGPYGHYLLNVDKPYSLALRSSIQQGYEAVKPGWTRISFPYYMSREEFEFVLDAVEFVATYGHKFLTLYHFNWRNGDWTLQKKAFEQVLNNAQNNLIHDELELASFMQDLKLRSRRPSYNVKSNDDRDDDDDDDDDDKNLTVKYDSYIKTAKFIGSLLPMFHEHRWVPEDLDVDLPFIV